MIEYNNIKCSIFDYVCMHNDLEMAKWMYNTSMSSKQQIHVNMRVHMYVYTKGYYKICKWLRNNITIRVVV